MARFRSLIANNLFMVTLLAVAALVVFFIPAIPALEKAIQRNAVLRESNRLITDVRFARIQAMTVGSTVSLCRSLVTDECRSDPAQCRCLEGTPRRQYEQGWLIFTAPDTEQNFDPDRDQLLLVGGPAPAGLTIRANTPMADRLSVRRDGSMAHVDVVRVAVCAGDESTAEIPGRVISFNMSGQAEISVVPPGTYCVPEG